MRVQAVGSRSRTSSSSRTTATARTAVRLTGSAFLPWGEIEPEKPRVTKGADSLCCRRCRGRHAKRCGKCFSLLYWTGYEGKIRVPYGSLIDEPALKPTAHMFVGSKAPWYEILDDLPQYDDTRGLDPLIRATRRVGSRVFSLGPPTRRHR